jgi:pimeloyl-ACP methyl ester carboxylesterase
MGDTAFPKVLWQRFSPGHAWGDVFHFRGFRIQEHGLDGTFRLLDPQRKRMALGTLADCHATFSAIREERKLAPMQGEVVILLHGIVRTARSLQSLERHLRESGFEVISADYPSTCCTIPECAAYLRRLIDSLEGVDKVHLAVHSMGGLVVRAYFAEQPDPRVGRVVMLGTPNHGAELATKLRGLAPFKWVFGPAGSQLASGPNEFVNDLPVPSVEFGIVAGARGNPAGFNPFVTGDDDGTVSVSSTRLAGATDFITIYSMHAFLPGAPDTVVAVERFFRTGAFRETGERQPIE